MKSRLLNDKREITRFQILVQIAENQPAISQTEIADSIGITPQAVSDHMHYLVDEGLVENLARGRYTVTKEGADLILSHAEELDDYLEHVTGDVMGEVFVETAVAREEIDEGDRVSIEMEKGRMYVSRADGDDSPTAVAVTAAEEGEDVGITEFEGLIEMEPGSVTVLQVPSVEDGGSREVETDVVRNETNDADVVFGLGTEAEVTLERSGVEDYIRYGVEEGVVEACLNGVSAVVCVVEDRTGGLTDRLQSEGIEHRLVRTSD